MSKAQDGEKMEAQRVIELSREGDRLRFPGHANASLCIRNAHRLESPLQCAASPRDAGWSKDIPDMLHNEDWNYAVFTSAKQHRAGVIHAECVARHKPLD